MTGILSNRENRDLDHIPGDDGPPIIGHTLSTLKDPSAFWIPFGGGAHMCLGLHFAYMMVKAILHRVLPRYRLVLSEGYEMPYQSLPIPRPKDGLPKFVERL